MRDKGKSVVSPLVSYDTEVGNLEQFVEKCADEIRGIHSGSYEPDATSPNLPNYRFGDSIESESPDWWRPLAATISAKSYTGIEEWRDEVIGKISGHEDFRLTDRETKDSLTGEAPPLEVYVGDAEERTETVSLRGEVDKKCVPVDRATRILSDHAPERDYNHDEVPEYNTEINGVDMAVEPDLSTGFFDVEADVGPMTYSSRVWMPYADIGEAALISLPSDFSGDELETDIVSVSNNSFTGDEVTDAVAESLSYYLPFEGFPQTEVSPEAIDYRNQNPMDVEPFKKRIEGNAWRKIKRMDSELARKFVKKSDKLAMRPDKKPLDKRGETNIDQIMGDDQYIAWTRNRSRNSINISDILDIEEAYPNGPDETRR
ncbi:MAG: hypothetical protein J07AB43_11510 [Candidatus Nanosalina sp. J07AB43]|nr:MAG: hypothetical protein J07AB43_11510 [Candidatus Nanosalina sp. J07AB43]